MHNQDKQELDDSHIGRLLVKFTIPAFLGIFIITLYNVVDTIFIGHYVGPLGIAGLSMVFPVQMLAMGIGLMIGMGGASLISRLIGAGNKPLAEHTLGNAVTITVVLSGILTIIGLWDVDFWLRLMGTSETIMPYARDFMTIILVGIFFETFAMALNNLIRSEGNPRVPMIGMVLGAVSNIILCTIFIVYFGWGVKGSALATVIAQLLSVIFYLHYYLSRKSYLKLHLENLFLKWYVTREILVLGIPSFVTMIAESLTAILINWTLIPLGGDMAISAFGIVNRLFMFAMMPGIAIGQGMQPILGFNYGARHYDSVLKTIKLAIVSATICCIIVFVMLYFFPDPFIRIFTNDAELITLSSHATRQVTLVLYLVGFIMVGSTFFQAIGKAAQSFVVTVVRSVAFLVPLVLLLPNFWQLDGVWLAIPITDGLTFMLTLALFIPQILRIRRKLAET